MYSPADLRTAILASDLSTYHKEKLLKKIKVYPPWELLPPSIQWNLCRVKLCKGEWDWKGWEYRSDWSKVVHEGRMPYPLWDGRKCRLLVVAEEGVGDEIMAASCFDDLFEKNPDTVVECDPRLIPVFRRTWGDRFTPRVTTWGERDSNTEMVLPLLDLFPIFRKSPKDCPGRPYLKPDPARREYWRNALTGRVGVAWASRHGKVHPRPVPGAVSLQYGHTAPEWCYQPDIDPLTDFGEQINLISALDRVISCPMSVVHAAGALGIPVTVVMPPYGTGKVHNTLHWRYECGLPFYANVEIVRTWPKSLPPSPEKGMNSTESGSWSPRETCLTA